MKHIRKIGLLVFCCTHTIHSFALPKDSAGLAAYANQLNTGSHIQNQNINQNQSNIHIQSYELVNQPRYGGFKTIHYSGKNYPKQPTKIKELSSNQPVTNDLASKELSSNQSVTSDSVSKELSSNQSVTNDLASKGLSSNQSVTNSSSKVGLGTFYATSFSNSRQPQPQSQFYNQANYLGYVPGRVATLNCVISAAHQEGVPLHVFLGIHSMERGRNGQTVQNKNKSLDMGQFQVNTIHFKKGGMFQHIDRNHATNDGCFNASLAAKLLRDRLNSKRISNDFWFRAAGYHSWTPALNYKYQKGLIKYANQWQNWLSLQGIQSR